jgi:hypothetical protein
VDNIKMDLGEIEWVVWAGRVWLRRGRDQWRDT